MNVRSGRLDVAALRREFPALSRGVVHLDGPGGTQTPAAVASAMHWTLVEPLANRGRSTLAERNADEVVRSARAAIADLLAVEPQGVAFGRSTTQNVMDLARTIAKTWRPGDEVVVTDLDHDANIQPWVLAASGVGATVRHVAFDPSTGELDPAAIEQAITPRTRLVAVTGASNLLGTIPDLTAISDVAHAAGALCFVDGVHYAAHLAVDLPAIGADFFTWSPYKLFGPHCGVWCAAPGLLADLEPDKLAVSTDAVPERFELGTLPYELLAGARAAVDFVAGLAGPLPPDVPRRERVVAAMGLIADHEDALLAELEERLRVIPEVVVHSRARRRTPTLLMSFADGRDPAQVSRLLAARGINAPAGSFYAARAAQALGLGAAGGLRVGLAPYNDRDDIARFVTALGDIVRQRV